MINKTNIKLFKLFLIFYIIYLLFLRGNLKNISHYVKYFICKLFNINFNQSNITISDEILFHVINNIKKIKQLENKKKLKFIDFGCGDGYILFKINKLFNSIDGIEIDKKTSMTTSKKLSNFNNVHIFNMDMTYYQFELTDSILFLFEPLFLLNKKKAKFIYHTIFNNINNIWKNTQFSLYIIYVSGLVRQDITPSFLKQYNFIPINKIQCCSLCLNRNMFIYKYKLNK